MIDMNNEESADQGTPEPASSITGLRVYSFYLNNFIHSLFTLFSNKIQSDSALIRIIKTIRYPKFIPLKSAFLPVHWKLSNYQSKNPGLKIPLSLQNLNRRECC